MGLEGNDPPWISPHSNSSTVHVGSGRMGRLGVREVLVGLGHQPHPLARPREMETPLVASLCSAPPMEPVQSETSTATS